MTDKAYTFVRRVALAVCMPPAGLLWILSLILERLGDGFAFVGQRLACWVLGGHRWPGKEACIVNGRAGKLFCARCETCKTVEPETVEALWKEEGIR